MRINLIGWNVVSVGHNANQMWSDMYKVVVMVMLNYESLVAKATRSFADPKWGSHGNVLEV